MSNAFFAAVTGQLFYTHEDWVDTASVLLTCHPEYHDTEHNGPAKGWRGNHFVALCFDQKGRRCRNGGDMRRAQDEGAFPVWWVWPDQIASLLMKAAAAAQPSPDVAELVAALEMARDLLEPFDDPDLSLGLGGNVIPKIDAALARVSANGVGDE